MLKMRKMWKLRVKEFKGLAQVHNSCDWQIDLPAHPKLEVICLYCEIPSYLYHNDSAQIFLFLCLLMSYLSYRSLKTDA